MGEVLRNLTYAQYRAIDAVYGSFLSAWRENAGKALYDRANPSEPTEALIFGNLVHLAVLEPDRFKAEYVRTRKFNLTKNVDKAEKAELITKWGAEKLIDGDRHDRILEIVKAINLHERAAALIAQSKDRELTFLWQDGGTGLWCKGKTDMLGGVILGDLKTTEDASRDNFQASIFKYGYHRQGAMYLRGARACGLKVQHYSILAVEKSPPYGVNVFSLCDEAIQQGDRELDDLLKQYKLHLETGEIPGYSQRVIDADLPDWAWRRLEFSNHIGG